MARRAKERFKPIISEDIKARERVAAVPSISTAMAGLTEAVKPKVDLARKPIIDVRVEPRVEVVPKVDVALDTRTEQELDKITEPTKITEPLRDKFRFKIPLFAPARKFGSQSKEGYNVHVREGEKRSDAFVKVNEKPLPFNSAYNLGARTADNTVSRTFKVSRAKQDTTLPDDLTRPIGHKYRKPKGKTKLPATGIFVEKSAFAIDSMGELMGITAKGIRARKQARLF